MYSLRAYLMNVTNFTLRFFASFFFQIVDKCLCDGADEYLQILSLCSVMMQQFCHAGQT